MPKAIIRQIKQLLAERKLRVGNRLPSERALADALAVSRNSVREALVALEAQGIVEIRHGQGTFLTESQLSPLGLQPSLNVEVASDATAVIEATEARQVVDIQIAGLAAERASSEDIISVRSYLQKSKKNSGLERVEFTFDLSFEKLLGKASCNRYLIELQQQVHNLHMHVWEGLGYIPWPAEVRLQQHEQIFDAVRDRDAARAREAMRHHLDLENIIARLDPEHANNFSVGNVLRLDKRTDMHAGKSLVETPSSKDTSNFKSFKREGSQ